MSEYSVEKWGDRFWPWSGWRSFVSEILHPGTLPTYDPGAFRRTRLFNGSRRVILVSELDAVTIPEILDLEDVPLLPNGSPDWTGLDQARIVGKDLTKQAFVAGRFCQTPTIGLPAGGLPTIERRDYVVAAARQLGVERIPVIVFYR